MTTKLTDIITDEVSLVGKGANRKKFLLFKSDKEDQMEELLKELLEELKPLDDEKDIVAKLKKSKMSEGDISVTKAALRLLSGVGEKVKKSGIVLKEFEQEPAKVDAKAAGEYLKGARPEDRQAVAEAAGIPTERFEQAFVEPKAPEVEGEILKADGSLDETKVPKELRPALQILFKDRQETRTQLKEANEKIEKAEQDKKRAVIRKKAEEVKDVPSVDIDELTETLMKLDEADQDKLLKPLRASQEVISKGDFFSEHGRPGPGAGVGSAIEKVNNLVAGLIKKDDKMTEADALTQIMRENPELYKEYTKETQIRA